MADKLPFKDAVPYLRPPKKNLKDFFYEPSTGAIFGRTSSSWAKIGLFYFTFYVVLSAMFTIMLWVFFQTLNAQQPRWKLESSLIGTNPGMGFRPTPSNVNVESTLIWYKGSNQENFQYWVDALTNFLEVYRRPGLTPGRGQNIYNCDYDRPPGRGQVCDVDVKNWHPCTPENFFNYHKSGPCIFLKLNKIYGWRPEYYNDTKDLPENMPMDLKEHIAAQKAQDPKLLNTVWVSCEGENPLDKENIGPVHYIPKSRGFPGYFYPFENNEGYLSPLMAVHLERPKITRMSPMETLPLIGHCRGTFTGCEFHSDLVPDCHFRFPGLPLFFSADHFKANFINKRNFLESWKNHIGRRNRISFPIYFSGISRIGVSSDQGTITMTSSQLYWKSNQEKTFGIELGGPHVLCIKSQTIITSEGQSPDSKTEASECTYSSGVLINIECKAWAKNIIHNQKEKLGSVHIELQID